MQKFTVITPTGDRPVPFSLCYKYVMRQTLLPSQWIIIDDGNKPMFSPSNKFIKYVRRVRTNKDPYHTLPVQMLEALKYVDNDIVFIIEDDDWYTPKYFEIMLKLLDQYNVNLLGQGKSIYYHMPTRRYWIHQNKKHSSWYQTVFRSNLIPQLNILCSKIKDPYVDLEFWKINTKKLVFLSDVYLSIGIKGLTGRLGTTSGHRNFMNFNSDNNDSFLLNKIGNDIKYYNKICPKK